MSASIPQRSRMSAGEYLDWERTQAVRHEFYNGEVFSQAGGTRNHSLIGSNVLLALGQRLKGNPCEVHGSDMRILIEATGYFAYPDVSVLCPPFEGPANDVMTNPVLLVEVLSPSTADFDRGGKFDHYRQVPTLREYLVIWQDQPRIEQRVRTGGEWLLRDISGFSASVELSAIEGRLALSDVYDKVVFESPKS